MKPPDVRQFPGVLATAMAVRFDYADGKTGVDFEPLPAFLSAAETTDWFQAWTGNSELDGKDFRVFGQDGTGGYAAIWLIRPSRPLAEQPIVFLGSEGETGVVARDLADGFGLWEAATSYEPDWKAQHNPELAAIAEGFAPHQRQSAAAVIELATREFPDLDDTFMDLCR
ncbi:SMI1/KNR4 family protein [Streptomyces sp. NPDC001251]